MAAKTKYSLEAKMKETFWKVEDEKSVELADEFEECPRKQTNKTDGKDARNEKRTNLAVQMGLIEVPERENREH